MLSLGTITGHIHTSQITVFDARVFFMLTDVLTDELVSDWRNQLWDIVLGRHCVGFARLTGLTLEGNPLAGLIGCLLLLVVGLDTVEELLTALRVLDVLNTNVDPLGKDLSAHALVDDDAEGLLRDVEHAASLAVVGLVGHALLEGAVALKNNEY